MYGIRRSVAGGTEENFFRKEKKVLRRLYVLLLGLSFFFVNFSIESRPVQAQSGSQSSGVPKNGAVATVVRAEMKNVDFHLTDRIVVHIATLEGQLAPNHSKIPVFDDKESFHLEVDSASILVSTKALSNDLNDYVFAKSDAPLKKLTITTQGAELILKGLLASKGGIPFETYGTVAATPDGQIRIHTLKVKAFHLPVKGLMDMLGLDTARMIDTNKVNGVTADKNDLILDPQQLLPPPQMRGHLSSIKVENGALLLVFGTEGHKGRHEAISNRCGGRNFLSFRGGTIRFGKLTMNDTDLELIDSAPVDPFDFSIDHYQDQLIAGYSKMTKQGGLCVHMPDFNKIKHDSQR